MEIKVKLMIMSIYARNEQLDQISFQLNFVFI